MALSLSFRARESFPSILFLPYSLFGKLLAALTLSPISKMKFSDCYRDVLVSVL